MKHNILETTVGFAVIILSLVFVVYTFKTANQVDESEQYVVSARFQNVDGIVKGSDVMLAGIKIGVVGDLSLDPESFFAVLSLRVHKNINLPEDSQAIVATSGLLGNKFIAINPGASEVDLKDGGEIKYTQPSINFEALIGKMLYNTK